MSIALSTSLWMSRRGSFLYRYDPEAERRFLYLRWSRMPRDAGRMSVSRPATASTTLQRVRDCSPYSASPSYGTFTREQRLRLQGLFRRVAALSALRREASCANSTLSSLRTNAQ